MATHQVNEMFEVVKHAEGNFDLKKLALVCQTKEPPESRTVFYNMFAVYPLAWKFATEAESLLAQEPVMISCVVDGEHSGLTIARPEHMLPEERAMHRESVKVGRRVYRGVTLGQQGAAYFCMSMDEERAFGKAGLSAYVGFCTGCSHDVRERKAFNRKLRALYKRAV